jgi:hypothetical protein
LSMKRELDLTGTLEERFGEFEKLLQGNARFSAATRLGQIAFCLPHLPPSIRKYWERKLSENVSQIGRDPAVRQGIENNVRRISQIVNHGGTYLFEELCLVLSLRLDVISALTFLECLDCQTTEESDAIRSIDQAVLDMAKDPDTRAAISDAAKHISRNFGLPIAVNRRVHAIRRRPGRP